MGGTVVVVDIEAWLSGLGLAQYAQAFRDAAIEPDVLPALTDEHLKELGLPLGHRLKIIRALGAAAPQAAEPAALPTAVISAERRQVSVMFCDLVGSTALASRLDPEDLRALIGRYHACVAGTVARFDGFVAKYMGDGVLVYFGYPAAREDDAAQAVRAALALVTVVAALALTPALSRSSAGEGERPHPLPLAGEDWGEGSLQVRIGIATGLVVVGDLIGAGSAQEQTAVGETPNLAARLQARAEPGAALIDQATRRQIGALFELADLGPQALKGYAEPQRAFRVLAENRVLGRFEALRSRATPLVGREQELALLLRRWEQAKSGSGSVVLIAAEAGIGKSRLAAERIAENPHIRLRYFCAPHHQDSALLPIITQMERAAGFAREDGLEAKLAKLRALIAPSAAAIESRSKNFGTRHACESGHDGIEGRELAEDLALLGELHGLPTAGIAALPDITPQKKKDMTFAALLRQIEHLAARQPVLMVFEDIHWIDPSSRELLDRAIERIAVWPVFLVATFRPEFQPPWVGQPHVTLLNLERLDARNTAAMVANISAERALPARIVAEIAERTDGVPLFVEELTKAVLESGAQVAPTLPSVPQGTLAVPATLHASLMARLDRLGAAVKDIAQKGAVIGREFSYDLLAAMADVPKSQLGESLASLTHAGLLFAPDAPPQSTYLFKHALVQDAAYGTLLRSRRQELHRKVAESMEARDAEWADARPELLAHHFTAAGLAGRAVPYWLKAGQQALARSAMPEAVALLRKGLDVLAGLPDGPWRRQQELDLQIALRPALNATKGYAADEVGAALARARELAEQSDRPDYLAPLLYGQWSFHFVQSEHRLALSLAEQLEKLGEVRNDIAAQLGGRRAHGQTRCSLGEFVAGRALLERCHGLADPAHRTVRGAGSEDPYAMMLGQLAVPLAYLGYIDQAHTRLNEALSEARRLRHASTLAFVLSSANLIDWLTRSPELQRHSEELLALSTEHDFRYGWVTQRHFADDR